MLKHRQTWRGEINLRSVEGPPKPLLVRADPVYAAADRVIGFVVIFTDNTEQKAATAARRQFQEGIIEQHRLATGLIGDSAGLDYQSLLSTVIENAQLAALEITDRADVERMPEMLESVRVSVARTTELLAHLVWHANRPAD